MVARNRGLISASLQRRIRASRLLIAGCGSIGGATVQPLARMGYTQFELADVGAYELNNLNRQHATVGDLGKNKAVVMAEHVKAINPTAIVSAHVDGITCENVRDLVSGVDVIVDGIDVTTSSGLRAKVLLHQHACRLRIPLITAWDMAGMLTAQYFDYRSITQPFDGELVPGDEDRLGTWPTIFRIAPRRWIPAEMFDELSRGLRQSDYNVPQLTEAAAQFGALAVHMTNLVVDGQHPRRAVPVDVHRVTVPLARRSQISLRRPMSAYRFLRTLPIAQALSGFAPKSVYQVAHHLTRKGELS
nr:ThiF family adenylyltransferase [Flexivirga aerilata]